MAVRYGETIAQEPLPVCEMIVDLSEVFGQLCRRRMFHGTLAGRVVAKSLCPPKSSKGRVHGARKIRHPAQSLISFWCSSLGEQCATRSNLGNIGKDRWRLGDRTVGSGHKCRDKAERIDG